jgi:hypothetical protein
MDKRSLIYFPAFNWNSVDGFMAGVALQNGTLIPKPVEYLIIPFYSFYNHGFTGYGKISLNLTPYDRFIRLATFKLEGSQFGAPGNQNFKNALIGLDLNFRSGKMINPVNQKVYGYYIAASDLMQIDLLRKINLRSYLQLGYQIEKTSVINPFDLLFSFEAGKSYQKTSIELNYKYSYYAKRGLDVRIFAGTMLEKDYTDPYYAFSVSGRSGREQYLYQGIYPDRFTRFPKTFWSRQMALSEGGLITFVNDSLGYSNWIFSLTLSSSLPGKASSIPVKPFINLLLSDPGRRITGQSHLFFEAGLKAGIWNFFEIYFPLLVSENINSLTGSFRDRIRFIFKLDRLNPQRSK